MHLRHIVARGEFLRFVGPLLHALSDFLLHTTSIPLQDAQKSSETTQDSA